MFGVILDILPRSLEKRLITLLMIVVAVVCLVTALALNAFSGRDTALALSYKAGRELEQYVHVAQRGDTLPAPYAGTYLQSTAAPAVLDEHVERIVQTQFTAQGFSLPVQVVFDAAPPRADLIAPSYSLENGSGLGAFVEAVTRQDHSAYLFVLESGKPARKLLFPKLWQDRLTEPVVFLLAALSLTILIVLIRSLIHATAAPLRDLAKFERADLQPWDTEEAIALQDKLVKEQEARTLMLSEQKRMLASISHDLRTPATRLRLRLEMIESAELRNRMAHDVEEMTRLITSSLDFLRFNAMMEEPQQLSLASLLQSLCDDYADTGHDVSFVPERIWKADQSRSIFGGGGAVELELEGRAVMKGQPTALRRAFTNLIDNALKYGGAATVGLDSHMHDRLTVTISDPGPGIPAHLHERVFDPFFRNDSSERTRSSSVGLGLSIVKQIINAHRGTISLGETEHGAFCISVELPRA